MTADNTRRGGRRWGRYLAGVVGVLSVAGLGAMTNIGTNLPLPDWEWLSKPIVVWSLAGVLIIVICIAAIIDIRSGDDEGDGSGQQRVVDQVDAGQVVINSPTGPVFTGPVHAQSAPHADLTQIDLPRQAGRAAEAFAASVVAGGRVGLVVTRFMSDPSGIQWEEIYNQVRKGATTTEITVQDARDAPSARVDILIIVHEARLVFISQSPLRTTMSRARTALREQPSMSIGIYLVGPECEPAKEQVNHWLDLDSPMASVYITGVESAAGLPDEMARLLQVVIDRDPRRSRPSNQADDFDGPGELYDARMGDY
ncbi:hypothetical protein [Micromonospora ureilytica]|uniref:Uncharacterized protein n=1 Tax=Micromonospora ureilytica TaxID=709868 RepID=A0ABS0JAJ3_9ACTN|nr:hypothetical protein [Micromonospora ureilytica]MBG6063750.1 hypothetical protein [Micromonospora ureilytica]